MTVSTSNRSQTFSGGQSVLTFNFRTLVSHPEYISLAVQSSGTNTILTYGSQYTVSVNSSGVGGTVTVTPTFGTNYTYVVYRSTAALQSSAYSDFNQFPSSTLENNLDQAIMIIQENSDNVTRSVSLPIGSNPSISTTLPLPIAGDFIGWDATALLLQNYPAPTGSTGAQGPVGPSGSSTAISSSTSDITIVTTSTTATITAVNAPTAGNNTIVRTDALGLVHVTNPYVKCSNAQVSGTNAGDATAGSWLPIPLNTKDSDTGSIATLSNSTISLPTGIYKTYAFCPFFRCNQAQARIFNITDAAVVLIGSVISADSGTTTATGSQIYGQFTLSATKILRLEYQVNTTKTANGLGTAGSFGTTEIYAQIVFERIS